MDPAPTNGIKRKRDARSERSAQRATRNGRIRNNKPERSEPEPEQNEIRQSDEKCLVCTELLRDMKFKALVECLSCKKSVHYECWMTWLTTNSKCIHCRSELDSLPRRPAELIAAEFSDNDVEENNDDPQWDPDARIALDDDNDDSGTEDEYIHGTCVECGTDENVTERLCMNCHHDIETGLDGFVVPDEDEEDEDEDEDEEDDEDSEDNEGGEDDNDNEDDEDDEGGEDDEEPMEPRVIPTRSQSSETFAREIRERMHFISTIAAVDDDLNDEDHVPE